MGFDPRETRVAKDDEILHSNAMTSDVCRGPAPIIILTFPAPLLQSHRLTSGTHHSFFIDMSAPVTIIVVHPRERRAKCTVQPLRRHSGFQFYKHPRVPSELPGYVRLGFGGPQLSPADSESGLLVLDGTWRWVEPIERLAASVPIRSLPPLVTAYPRSSKVSTDPEGGLATIEAIYAAYRLLGRDTTSLLDHYHWGQEFVEKNVSFWPDLKTSVPTASKLHRQ